MASRRVAQPRHLPDHLLAEGVSWVTTEALASRLGVEPARVPDSLERARTAGRIMSITKGAWLVVPPEYLRWGAPPPTHYVDAWMRHLGHPYYVGLLSAAGHHGITHHASHVFHVVTAARLRDRTIGRSRIAFVHTVDATSRPTVVTTVPTGRLVVASVEVTLLDLVAHPKRSGGLGNVATIVANAVQDDHIDAQRIVETASSYRPAVVQRLGFVIERAAEHLGSDVDLEALAQFVRDRRTVPLDLRAPAHGPTDPRWRVLMNAPLEIDA
jgi:predicted transcriptional regulator of viral defense system